MEFGPYSFIASMFAVTLGAVLQAATGLGAGLIIVPLLALISLELVPGPIIFASLTLTLIMSYKGRSHINFTSIDKVLAGLLIGLAAGAYTLALLPLRSLGTVFGLFILIAVLVSFMGIKIRQTSLTMITAGALSGFMGATTAIGAPVLALLYQYEEGRVLRATLALLYFVSSVAALILLHFAGQFNLEKMVLGVYLIPGFLLGYFLSSRIAKMVDRGYSRMAVLIISSTSAIALIGKSIL